MTQFDVFNGDADGLCALHQLRLAHPVKSELITGVKRDINLLQHVFSGKNAGENVNGNDTACVLDISLDCNREPLLRLLDKGVKVQWFDHHFAGDIPAHPDMQAHINTAPDVCTSLLVNRHLQGMFLPWAVVAAFGDNLYDVATRIAASLDLGQVRLQKLRHLGECLNYNGYGITADDLYFHPSELYWRMKPFSNPFAFIETDDAFTTLRAGMNSDISRAREIRPEFEDARIALFILPDKAWCRRVSGIFSNELARTHPDRAHAVAMLFTDEKRREAYRISVRAPLNRKYGADELCRQFPAGGGRKAAAGINALPQEKFGEFVSCFQEIFLRR